MNRRGLKREFRKLDEKVWNWSNGVADITKNMVQDYAKKTFLEAGITTFKASDGWYRRWRKRWRVEADVPGDSSVRKVAHQLPVELNRTTWNDNMSNSTNGNQIEVKATSLNHVLKSQNNILSFNDACNKDANVLEQIGSVSESESTKIKKCIERGMPVVGDITSIICDRFQPDYLSLFNDILDAQESCQDVDCTETPVDILLPNDHVYNSSTSDTIIGRSNYDFINADDDTTHNEITTKPNELAKNRACDIHQKCWSNNLVANQSEVLSRHRKKGERYLPQFKSKVIAYARAHSIKSAAIKYSVSSGTISEWVRSKSRKDNIESDSDKNLQSIDTVFIKWLNTMRQEQRLLSSAIIKAKLSEMLEGYRCKKSDSKKRLSWLHQYYDRLNAAVIDSSDEESEQILKTPVTKYIHKYILYPAEFKEEVALYASKSSRLAAARTFCVARKRVFEWSETMKTKGTILNNKAVGLSYVTDAAIDKEILNWYNTQQNIPRSREVRKIGRQLYREKGYRVSCSSGWYYRWRKRFKLTVTSKSTEYALIEWLLCELDRNKYLSHSGLIDHAVASGIRSSFKASRGWVIRFCKRYTSLLQKTPNVDTMLPPSMETKVVDFRNRIQRLIEDLQLDAKNIGTVDEIPIQFVHNSDKKRSPLIRRPGFDDCQASLIIAALADGTFLPWVLVLKGASGDISLNEAENVSVFCRKNGCVDEEIMLYWLTKIWFSAMDAYVAISWFSFSSHSLALAQGCIPIHGGRFQPAVSLLLSDDYWPHTCSRIKEAVSTSLCHHELFPPGCSSKLQPFGVNISNLIKKTIEQSWKDTIDQSLWTHNSSACFSLPSHQNIIKWVVGAHCEISSTLQEQLMASFNSTLLSINSNQ